MGTEGPLVAEIGREPVVTRKVAPRGEKDVVLFAQVDDAADIVAGPIILLPGEVKQLTPQVRALVISRCTPPLPANSSWSPRRG